MLRSDMYVILQKINPAEPSASFDDFRDWFLGG
jgi:hypothetical protein